MKLTCTRPAETTSAITSWDGKSFQLLLVPEPEYLRTARAERPVPAFCAGRTRWRSSTRILTKVVRQGVAQNSEADREVAIDSMGVGGTSASEYFEQPP